MAGKMFILLILICWFPDFCHSTKGRFCSCIPQSCDFSNHCVPAGNCKKVNVALGMTANMSQEWTNSGPACLAVDGRTDGNYKGNPNPNCICTADNMNNPFWQVDLGQQFKVKYITVYTMESYEYQMQNVMITVDNQECYTFGSSNINLVENVTCHQARIGRYIKFNKTSSYLAFCEVQVWICIDQTYGKDCAQSCGQCLGGEPCDIETGQCDSCEHGFSPPLCQTCLPGFSPPLCQTCLPGFSPPLCQICQPGLRPPLCQSACNNGTYGHNCSQPCGNCTNKAQCDPVDGTCTSCSPGFIPPLCQSHLSTEYSKYACEGSLLSIACPQNYVIQIVSFNYGRLSSSICVNQWSNGNLQCRSAPSKGIVSTRCNGLPQCDVPVSNSLFGDPCYGTSKYGEVQYICKRTETVAFTKLACEDAILSFSCPTNQVIKIVNFNYGRLSSAVCVNRWSNNNLNCKAPWSKDVVSTRCDGLQSCEFHVNNANFGDPCYGTSKYGEVMYTCE